MKKQLKIKGTIKRNCDTCNKLKNCNSFFKNGKTRLLCLECTFKEFGVGKPKKTEERHYCNDCNGLTMKRIKENEKVTDHYIIHYFKCEKCKNRTSRKLKRKEE